ncbi:hypothetical protein IC580_18120 [Cupriavidus sp. ISTL7]|nr:hypothetical protein IC580_18120 [Cupriavidus sp. ISTL7]
MQMRQQAVDLMDRGLTVRQPVAVDHRNKVPWRAADDRAQRGVGPFPYRRMLAAAGRGLQRADQCFHGVLQHGDVCVCRCPAAQAIAQRMRLRDGAAAPFRSGKRARRSERTGGLALGQQRVEQRNGRGAIAGQARGNTFGQRHAGAPAQQAQRGVDMAGGIRGIERDAGQHGFGCKGRLEQRQRRAWMHRIQGGLGVPAINMGLPAECPAGLRPFGTRQRLTGRTADGGNGRGKHDGSRLDGRAERRNVALPCEAAVEADPTL